MNQNLTTLAAVISMTLASPIVNATNNVKHNVFGGIEYVYNSGTGESDNSHSNGYAITLGGQPLNWLALDLRTEYSAISTDVDFYDVNLNRIGSRTFDTNDSKLEVGASPFYDWSNGLGLYSRIALGFDAPEAFDNFTYGSVETGVSYKPRGLNDNTQMKVGYRYRDQFGSDSIGIGSNDFDRNFRTNSLMVTGEYAINSRDSITVGYEYADGDLNYNEFRVGYMAHF